MEELYQEYELIEDKSNAPKSNCEAKYLRNIFSGDELEFFRRLRNDNLYVKMGQKAKEKEDIDLYKKISYLIAIEIYDLTPDEMIKKLKLMIR